MVLGIKIDNMKYLIAFLLVYFVSCKENKIQNRHPILVSTDSVITKLDTKTINNRIINYEPKTVNNNTWVPIQFLKSIYVNGVNNAKRNEGDYPFESVYIENWENYNIYAESGLLEYRKIKIKVINDSTYYLPSWNKHEFKNKDSLFIVKRKNGINFISKRDTIKYTSGIGDIPFKNASLIKNIHTISFYNKTFDLYNENQIKIDKNITFNLAKNTINNSSKFKNYTFTGYNLNGNYLIKLDTIDYFFKWKDRGVILESQSGNKFTLLENKSDKWLY